MKALGCTLAERRCGVDLSEISSNFGFCGGLRCLFFVVVSVHIVVMRKSDGDVFGTGRTGGRRAGRSWISARQTRHKTMCTTTSTTRRWCLQLHDTKAGRLAASSTIRLHPEKAQAPGLSRELVPGGGSYCR